MKKENPAKAHYQRLRHLSCEELWETEVPAFERADPVERVRQVGVVRAVGVVFSESGSEEQKRLARDWLRGLLQDPEEKVRRYAMTALPKVGGDAGEEAALLALLGKTSSGREMASLGRTLEKIGGAATLTGEAGQRLDARTLRKVETNVARHETPGEVLLDRPLEDFSGLHLHLHCREGLEEILAEELDERVRAGAPFRRVRSEPGLVVATPRGPFTLGDVFALRCFGQAGIVPGKVPVGKGEVEALTDVITSPRTVKVLQTFTEGPLRYRLEFLQRGHQRSAVKQLADRISARCPALWNDARSALWQINIGQDARNLALEITPRLRPDPRFAYRLGDVPAASHPPLAACLARVAGELDGDVVWDPFCGSGLELIERARRGGVHRLFGTDLSAGAISTAEQNLAAAAGETPAVLTCGDFRDYQGVSGLASGSVSLVITNPPLGRRVPIPDLPGLIHALFAASADVLKPGGRLVLVNPRTVTPDGLPLRLGFRRRIDLGGFHCHLERYSRV